MKPNVQNLVICAMCIALGVVFPMFFHLFGGVGTMLLPMHLPILVCGFMAGPMYGFLCGMITPLLSSSLTGMPPFYPIALAMVFELATYGLLCGYCFKKWQKVYPSLLCAMVLGRCVSGLVNLCLLSMAGKAYTLEIFISASFISALPGILLQLTVIPILMFALDKSGIWRKRYD